ncbi:MipA/OmpV family protein [Pseudomonas capsici]|uniref:MipA/OmpV family protein n=1 Tax=Pseudomonas capsici TaxID=2810614 RepID=UPI0021F13D99|nr:MipA/OmpV family protein [Pseudomonas capsici]MCV4276064.1 MipA/OmpV family protein [Pseudomonas capsici]
MHRSETQISRFTPSIFSLVGLSLMAMAQLHTMPASAEERRDGQSNWGIGLGVMSEKTPYAGRSRETDALPLIQYENDYIEVFGPQIAFKLPRLALSDSQTLDFSLVAEYDGSGYDDDDADILDGMDDRKSGFWAGGRVVWGTDLVDVKAEWLGDVSGHSNGQRISLGLERTWQVANNLQITPRLVANWYDEQYVDYYFGVRSDEARTWRAAYEGKSGVNTEIGVRSVYKLDHHNSMFVDLEVSNLSSEIEDSPLVDRSTQNKVTLGYLYRF